MFLATCLQNILNNKEFGDLGKPVPKLGNIVPKLKKTDFVTTGGNRRNRWHHIILVTTTCSYYQCLILLI